MPLIGERQFSMYFPRIWFIREVILEFVRTSVAPAMVAAFIWSAIT